MTISEIQLPERLYSHWDNLPALKELNEEIGRKLRKKPIRNSILYCFTKGVLDNTPKGKKRRHSLTVVEIQDLLLSNTGEEAKKSSIYYHLEILIELGIVQELTSVKSGNIVTTYFGRTSKLVLLQHMAKDEPYDSIPLVSQTAFKELLTRVSPDSDIEVKDLLENIIQIRGEKSKPELNFASWVNDHSEDLVGLDLNLMDLYNLFAEIHQYPVELIEQYAVLRRLLKMD